MVKYHQLLHVLKSCLSCIHTSFQANTPTFQERTCSPAYYVLSKLFFMYFQEKAQVTIPTFLERTCTSSHYTDLLERTCAPSHNTYCRSCLSNCSINIIILTAQDLHLFRNYWWSSQEIAAIPATGVNILNTYYVLCPPTPNRKEIQKQNKTKQKTTTKKTNTHKKNYFVVVPCPIWEWTIFSHLYSCTLKW